MVRGKELEGADEREKGKTDEGEPLERIYNDLLEYLLHYITFYPVSKDMSIV